MSISTDSFASKRILLIEDDQRLSESLSRALIRKGFKVKTVSDGNDGLRIALADAFDLVILDIVLPGMDGYALCQQLRRQKPRMPILMLTALDDTEDRLKGFEQGTDDYLAKPFDMRELQARILALLRRSEFLEETRTRLRMADLEMDLQIKMAWRSGQELDLTSREYALLEYMLLHPRRLITKPELLEQVWGLSFDPGTNIVEVYIAYLRKKVDRHFDPKLIHTKSGQGYILKSE
ncbi:MAG: response regulator transcription factor [Siphonobacter sp.]